MLILDYIKYISSNNQSYSAPKMQKTVFLLVKGDPSLSKTTKQQTEQVIAPLKDVPSQSD